MRSLVRRNGLILNCILLILATSVVRAEKQVHDCVIEPHAVVELSSSEVGVLDEVTVDKADLVKKGQKVAALRTDVERAALALSRARSLATGELAVLRETMEFNARRRKRIEELHRTGVMSHHDADEIRTDELLAGLRLSQAAEQYELAALQAERDRLLLQRRVVTSPLDGVVVDRFKSPGEYVDGDTIIQVAQIDPLRIELLLPISLYGTVEPGMKAGVMPEIAAPGPHLATVSRIDPVIDAATATFGVRLSLPNPDGRLPAGQKCSLYLLTPTLARLSPVALEAFPFQLDGPREHEEAKPDLCRSLGPISEDQLTDLEHTLANGGLRHLKREVQKAAKTIVISEFPSDAEAINAARKHGLEDVERIYRGPFAGHLSYGVYSTPDRVAARLSSLEGKGLSALAKPLSYAKEIWFDLFSLGATDTLAAIQSQFPELRVAERPCEQLASN